MNNWHLIFDTMTKVAAELCLEEFEKNGSQIVNVQCLGEFLSSSGGDQQYKWLFILKEPINNISKEEVLSLFSQ